MRNLHGRAVRRGGGEVVAMIKVQKFLSMLKGKNPSSSEVSRIAPELQLIFEKYNRIRSLYPSCHQIDLSPQMWTVLSLVGLSGDCAKLKAGSFSKTLI